MERDNNLPSNQSAKMNYNASNSLQAKAIVSTSTITSCAKSKNFSCLSVSSFVIIIITIIIFINGGVYPSYIYRYYVGLMIKNFFPVIVADISVWSELQKFSPVVSCVRIRSCSLNISSLSLYGFFLQTVPIKLVNLFSTRSEVQFYNTIVNYDAMYNKTALVFAGYSSLRPFVNSVHLTFIIAFSWVL